MKNLLIALSLVSSLMIASNAAAEVSENIEIKEVETIVVVSKPEVANFEIYSLDLADAAMESVMDAISEGLSTPLSNVGNNLNEATRSLAASL